MDGNMNPTNKEISKELDKMVKSGKLAKIYSYDKDKSEEIQFINSSQVIIKCPNCKHIIGENTFHKSPKE